MYDILCVTNIMFDLKNEFDFFTRDRNLLQISTKISGAVFPLNGINSFLVFAFLRSIYWNLLVFSKKHWLDIADYL